MTFCGHSRSVLLATVGLTAVVLSACGEGSTLKASRRAVTGPPAQPSGERCPSSLVAHRNGVQISMADVVRWKGELYIANLRGQQQVPEADVGAVVARVDCSPNGLTASYLRRGAQVHALLGFSPICRLVAVRVRANQVYERVIPGQHRPAPCPTAAPIMAPSTAAS